MMKRTLPFLIVILLLAGCSAAHMNFNVLAPAPLWMPNDIQTIALIDRSIPENSELNRLEGILTGEGARQDKVSTQYVLEGLKGSLTNSTRYVVIKTDVMLKGSGSGSQFPAPLDWETIDDLVSKYNADAIVSLETYDSDFIITGAKLPSKTSPGAGAGGVATVNCGFRMYWPAERTIQDEYRFSHSMNWDAGGPAILAAINTVRVRNEAINNASRAAGVSYGRRITPTWFRVQRDYFKKSKGDYDFEEGARMMQLNDWDKAIAALTKASENGHPKTRGRAAHNLAVVYEILGDLPTAKEWTTVAWGRYKEKKSRDYGYILTNRIIEQENLNQQMQKK